MIICSNCGTTNNESAGNVCRKCGALLPRSTHDTVYGHIAKVDHGHLWRTTGGVLAARSDFAIPDRSILDLSLNS